MTVCVPEAAVRIEIFSEEVGLEDLGKRLRRKIPSVEVEGDNDLVARMKREGAHLTAHMAAFDAVTLVVSAKAADVLICKVSPMPLRSLNGGPSGDYVRTGT